MLALLTSLFALYPDKSTFKSYHAKLLKTLNVFLEIYALKICAFVWSQKSNHKKNTLIYRHFISPVIRKIIGTIFFLGFYQKISYLFYDPPLHPIAPPLLVPSLDVNFDDPPVHPIVPPPLLPSPDVNFYDPPFYPISPPPLALSPNVNFDDPPLPPMSPPLLSLSPDVNFDDPPFPPISPPPYLIVN